MRDGRSEEIEQRLHDLSDLAPSDQYIAPSLSRLINTSHRRGFRRLIALNGTSYGIGWVRDGHGWCHDLVAEPAKAEV